MWAFNIHNGHLLRHKYMTPLTCRHVSTVIAGDTLKENHRPMVRQESDPLG